MKDVLGLVHLVRATRNSLVGVRDAFRTGCAFRQEVVFGLVQLVALAFVPERAWLKLTLVCLWVVLMATELMNSAVEAVVDLASPGWHELAKHAKDFASAAVFLIVLLIASVWLYVIGHRLFGL